VRLRLDGDGLSAAHLLLIVWLELPLLLLLLLLLAKARPQFGPGSMRKRLHGAGSQRRARYDLMLLQRPSLVLVLEAGRLERAGGRVCVAGAPASLVWGQICVCERALLRLPCARSLLLAPAGGRLLLLLPLGRRGSLVFMEFDLTRNGAPRQGALG